MLNCVYSGFHWGHTDIIAFSQCTQFSHFIFANIFSHFTHRRFRIFAFYPDLPWTAIRSVSRSIISGAARSTAQFLWSCSMCGVADVLFAVLSVVTCVYRWCKYLVRPVLKQSTGLLCCMRSTRLLVLKCRGCIKCGMRDAECGILPTYKMLAKFRIPRSAFRILFSIVNREKDMLEKL